MIDALIAERYKIIKKIGTGGTAEVYLADDLKLSRKVAIKILSRFFASERNFVIRFKKEAQTLAKLNDKNIVAIYDWGTFENSYFICMEYVQGESLKEIIEKHGIINPHTAVDYAIQICSALEVAHKNNLIHRDIKPQNIIITEEGIAKITDFGIAKSVIEDTTKTLNVMGTALYVSPEQAQGKYLSYSTDIYSLGIVIYEMLTADVPFRGENSIEISLKHINEKPLPPSMLVDNFPLKLEKILLKCIEKNPEDRYENISLLKEDLNNFKNRKPLIEERLIKSDIRTKAKNPIKKISLFKINGYLAESKPSLKNIHESSSEIFLKNKIAFLKKLFYITAASLFALIITFAVLFAVFFNRAGLLERNLDFVKIPDLTLMPLDRAEKIAKNLELELIVSEEVSNEDVYYNHIISQDPKEGAIVDKNSSIVIAVSKGFEKISDIFMPNILGMSLEESEKYLNDLNLKPAGIYEEFSDTFEEGRIIKQNPEPMTIIDKNTQVSITISKGSDIALVPNIIGYDFDYALSQIESLGIKSSLVKIFAPEYKSGTVINTDPFPGTRIYPGETVKLFIATDELMIQVPDMTQMGIEKAKSILSELNISYEIIYVRLQHDIQLDLVVNQFPEAGSFIYPGEKVILAVGSQP